MNYRHIYHAGNFADVFKHVLLTRVLAYLIRKPAPLRFIDTHAGIGRYDLTRNEAARTGEWRGGVGRVLQASLRPEAEALLAPYRAAIGPCGQDGAPLRYPGSPAIAQAILRPIDTITAVERHPEDVAALRRVLQGDRRVTVLAEDGYRALNAILPPPERRGVVLIDPPYEAPDEAEVLTDALAGALRKWATGTFAVWYPIKDAAAPRPLRQGFARLAPGRRCTLEIAREAAGPALRGCGLFVINPPFTLSAEAAVLLPWLCRALDDPALPPFRWQAHADDAVQA